MTYATSGVLAYGDAGVSQTLARMVALANEGPRDALTLNTARAIAVASGVRGDRASAMAIEAWLRRSWFFVEDPLEVEVLSSPGELLRRGQQLGRIPGDCDEAAILGAALGKAIGLAATFVVLGFDDGETPGGRLAHVYAVLTTPDGDEISLDVTKPAGPVPEVTRAWAIDV